MLVDANVLLYSVDATSIFHTPAFEWVSTALNGSRRVGIPWVSLTAFVRISTNPRASLQPLTPSQAWQHVEDWIDAPAAWIPSAGKAHQEILKELIVGCDLRAGLVTDAVLVALCIEHGLDIVSADSDFARFKEVRWINPVGR